MAINFTPNNWENGQVITAEKLNNTDNGVSQAVAGVNALQSATATASSLEAGQNPTVTFSGTSWAFGIPKGDTGATGEKGADGAKGDKGDAGAQGAKGVGLYVSTVAVTASTTNALTGLPQNTVQAIAVGDCVLDATTKKIYQVTDVDETNYTVGAEIATLP